MTAFSANLGFLWLDRALPDAIRSAAAAGFDAVECHWPYDADQHDVRQALDETGLPLISLNTRRGDTDKGENGLAALPGREQEARAAIDEAFDWADALDARAVHVMAGVASGADAEEAFISNLNYAARHARSRNKTVVIEPLNPSDAPGYFLASCEQAARIIAAVGAEEIRLMFDCYHVARIEGAIIPCLDAYFDLIGHIQFAGVPHRGHPDQGEVDYRHIFARLSRRGYQQPLGAEYRPDDGDTDASLNWLETLRI